MYYYKINVALDGKHLFATATHSVTSEVQARFVKKLFDKKFPEKEGYVIDVTLRYEVAECIDFDKPKEEKQEEIRCRNCGTSWEDERAAATCPCLNTEGAFIEPPAIPFKDIASGMLISAEDSEGEEIVFGVASIISESVIHIADKEEGCTEEINSDDRLTFYLHGYHK